MCLANYVKRNKLYYFINIMKLETAAGIIYLKVIKL